MKRAVSFALALAVLLALLPVQAFANSAEVDCQDSIVETTDDGASLDPPTRPAKPRTGTIQEDDYWNSINEKIEEAEKGSSSESGAVPSDIIDAAKDKDVEIELELPTKDYEVSVEDWNATPADDFTYTSTSFICSITGYTGSDTRVVVPSEIQGLPVREIAEGAFQGNRTIQEVVLPESVSRIDRSAFQSCASLTSVDLPQSLTSIGDFVFDGCESLADVDLPKSITSIGSSAFSGCKSLTSIHLPDGLTSIGSYGFYECKNLTSIDLPSSLATIGHFAFSSCTGLTSIVLPNGVTDVSPRTFFRCTALSSVVLPKGVTTIGEDAFRECTSLSSIALPDGLTTIGEYAFKDCTSLTSIALPEGITIVDNQVFSGCVSLVRADLPKSLITINTLGFDGCDNLTIYCYAGSAAHEYAKRRHIPYELKDASLTKLATPTDLQWGIEYHRSRDENDQWQYTPEDFPGMISWRNEGLHQNMFLIRIFNQDGEELDKVRHRFNGDNSAFDVDSFLLSDLGNGSYYFTVQAVGDETQYLDSDIATSELWTYTAPEAQLPQVTGLRWGQDADSRSTFWEDIDAPDGVSYGYEIEYFYTPDPNEEEPYSCGSTWFRSAETGDRLDDWSIEGPGYYYFKVRALSNEIETVRNGPWSELCGPYNLTEISGSLEKTLEEISWLEDPDEILEAVKELNRDDLSAAMLADTDDSGIVGLVRELETAADVSTEIQVDPAMQGHFPSDNVSVVGAGLNLPGGSENRVVSLNIGAADQDVVIPTTYHNTVQFSMQLENAEPELSFPVKITLPVPASINPDFLIVLHYHHDGSYEEIHPILTESGGVSYASFTVTSFSTFVMAENKPEQLDDFGLNPENQSKILSGLPLGMTPAELKAHYQALGKDVSVQAPDGTTPKCVGTGCEVLYGGATYTVLLYGDLAGDGTIDVMDLLQIKNNILGIRLLDGFFATAADLDRNGEVGVSDLLLLKKHILGISTIQQSA